MSATAARRPASEIEAELARAQTEMDYRDWDAAIRTLDAALKREPRLGQAMLLRGNAHAGKALFDDAISDYNQALTFGATPSIVYSNRAIAWQRKGDLERAKADLDRSLSLEPKSVAALIRRAGLMRRMGNHDAAVTDYDAAIRLEPGNADLLSLRRLALGNRKERESTRTALPATSEPHAVMSDRITSDGRTVDGHVRRGYELIAQAAIEAAIAEFDRALVAQPISYLALTGRAHAFAMRQRYTEALADLNAAFSINSGFAPVHTVRGLVFLMRGEHERAIAALDEALRLDASAADAYCYRGAARAAMKLNDYALGDLDRSLSINPKLTLALSTRGRVHAARGEHDLALTDFSAALKLAPDAIATHLQRGQSYEALGRADDALADYGRVLELKAVSAREAIEQLVARRRIKALVRPGEPECPRGSTGTCL